MDSDEVKKGHGKGGRVLCLMRDLHYWHCFKAFFSIIDAVDKIVDTTSDIKENFIISL